MLGVICQEQCMMTAYRCLQVNGGHSPGLSPCPCVPVLDLIDGLLAHFKAHVLRVVLDGDDVEVSGTLYVGGNDGEATLPCHPADGLALAERTGAPIYATDEVLRHACPLGQPHHHETGLPHVTHAPNGRGQRTFMLTGKAGTKCLSSS
jgi:hypothetical protein